MKLTSKQRAFLRKSAHNLEPIFRVGKDGFSDALAQGIDEAIGPRELIKVKILQNSEVEKREIAERIAEAIEAQVVEIIGRTIVLFKENKDKPTISLDVKKIK
ncbi:ribosome assembly RNA-binding protein YhbY [Cetobacterium sp. SF1]|uniref:ribosome assembly RNA-binding protein YhbY n=1 Tax=unclassified Cetobacterium TaxID=2630983 RepID=UPI003CE784B4